MSKTKDFSNKLNINELLAISSFTALLLSIVFVFGLSYSIDHPVYKYFSISDYSKIGIIFLTPVLISFAINIPVLLLGLFPSKKIP